ncbi:hypothetical protein Q7P37_011141 [Cladosporium fusiforme]
MPATEHEPSSIETLVHFSNTLSSIVRSTRSIYNILSHRYHTLPTSIQRNPLIHLRKRDLIAMEFAIATTPGHPTPFEQTVSQLEACGNFLRGIAASNRVLEEIDIAASIAVLRRAKSLSGEAMVQLCGLWNALAAHECLEQWMAHRGIITRAQTRT